MKQIKMRFFATVAIVINAWLYPQIVQPQNNHTDMEHQYDMVRYYNGCSQVKVNGKWGLVDETGREIIRPKYDEMQEFSEGLAVVKVIVGDRWDGKRKCGYINTNGEEIIPLKYDDASNFSCGLGRVSILDNKFFIDNIGNKKLVFTKKYDQIGKSFDYGLLPVRFNEKWGFINTQGEEVLVPKYNAIQYFKDGYAGFEYKDKWGVIKLEPVLSTSLAKKLRIKKGDRMDVISMNSSTIIDSSVNVKNKEYRLVEIITPKYDWVSPFFDGFAIVCINNKKGAIDTLGNIIIPVRYDYIGHCSDGLFAFCQQQKYGFLDSKGNTVIPAKFSTRVIGDIEYPPYDENKGEPCAEDYGDKSAEVFDYDRIGFFHDGRALIQKDFKYGYIDKNGNVVIPIKYKTASKFKNDCAFVSESDYRHARYIDTMGNYTNRTPTIERQDPFLTRPQHGLDIGDLIVYFEN